MKILYSQIQKLVPNLKTPALEVGQVLTMTGFMLDGYQEVIYQGRPDYLLSFEIRQNRADCLSTIGLAYEIAAYYGLRIELPTVRTFPETTEKLNLKVNAIDDVKRVTAIRLTGLKNGKSPDWLTEYLNLYDINSVNLLVDLSNYIMLLTGYPSHLIDLGKVSGNIAWSINNHFDEITTLDGTKVALKKNELIIEDTKNIIALAGIIGGRAAEIDSKTTSIIAEIAIYDQSVVRRNSRSLRTITEASQRLEKYLDPNGAEYALALLTSNILEYCGGQTGSQTFDYYPQKRISPVIEFDPKIPSVIAGIEVPIEKSFGVLKNLGCNIKKGESCQIIPPTRRTDLAISEDLAEEVIRLIGYDKIPTNQIPKLEIVKDITPKKLHLIDKIKDFLVAESFDEILSWPLTQPDNNEKTNYWDWQEIKTQNSVNEEYPYLRQSIGTGLFNQIKEYFKKNIEYVKIFEIGKVFGKKSNDYSEFDSLGILNSNKANQLNETKDVVERLLRYLGLNNISYKVASIEPKLANPSSCWDIKIQDDKIGIIYKAKPLYREKNIYFIELNIDKITGLLKEIHLNPVTELTSKLIILDVNIELSKEEMIDDYLAKLAKREKYKNIFSVSISDKFPLGNKIKYTLRVSYKNISDQEAKNLHFRIFGIK